MTPAHPMPRHDSLVDVPPGFVDAVMRAVSVAPLPSPTRAFTSALQEGSRSEAHGALAVAWRLIRAGTAMPVLVRAQALALLLIVGGSMVGGSAVAAVATYQTVAPILRSFVDPSADDGGIPIPPPAVVEPSSEPSPSPSPTSIPALEPPGPSDVADPSEPASGGDTDDGPYDDPDDDDADEPDGDDPDGDEPDGDDPDGDEPDGDDPDGDDPDSDSDTGETDDSGVEDDRAEDPEADSEEPGGDADDASDDPDEPDDAEPDESGDAEPDEPDDAEPDDPDRDD